MTNKLAFLAVLVLGFAGMLHFEKQRTRELERQLHLAQFELDRFTNPVVFHSAQKIAKITGAPLYQVLTGKLDPQGDD